MATQSLDLKALKYALEKHLNKKYSSLWEIELLAHGEANAIFRLNQTDLIRVAINTPNQRFSGAIQRITQFEHAILNYLESTDISHQLQGAQLEPATDFPYTYLITNYLEGIALDYSRSHLQTCAETLARLHRLPAIAGYEVDRLLPTVPIIQKPLTLFYQEAEDYAQPYLNAPDAKPEIVDMLRTVLNKARSRLCDESLLDQYPYHCLVHGDHTYENWVMGDRQAYLIDWEWAEISSPAGDLGHFLSPVTIRRRQGYRLPVEDRQFFLQRYYDALDNPELATRIQHHFSAFGVYPAVRSLCWTAGYWVTANLWYADADNNPSSAERVKRWQQSRQQFSELWSEVMIWFDEMNDGFI